jgi:hypothetical protein
MFEKKVKCGVCEASVKPKREKTMQTNTGLGGLISHPVCVDVMDCPECGCQICLKVREVREYKLEDGMDISDTD